MATNNSFSATEVTAEFVKEGGFVGDVFGSIPLIGPSLAPDNANHPFAKALQETAEQQMKSDALKDVGHVGLAGLGLGAGTAGAFGLARMFKKRKKRENAPVLPLPYPVEPEETPSRLLKRGDFSMTPDISSKAGIPWYGPAMLFTGMAGLGAGWKGVDSVLKRRAKADREEELESARSEFQNALMSQYDKPFKSAPKLAADGELSSELDRLFDLTQQVIEKRAMTLGDVGGMTAGAYGIYGGLSGLLAGSIVYDQMKKRSRAAVLDKAMKKRERRRFAQSPPEIYAMPEPTTPSLGTGNLTRADVRALKTTPEDTSLET